MLRIVSSDRFKGDLKAAQRRGLNLDLLRTVVNTLAEEKALAPKYRDHSLTGVFQVSANATYSRIGF